MRSLILCFVFFLSTVTLSSCANTPINQQDLSKTLPMGVSLGLSDVACEDIRNVYLPARLQYLDISFRRADDNEEMLSVGPFVEEMSSVSAYPKLRQTYFLQVLCWDELTTTISGDVILEGLGKTGQWVWINDPVAIENQSMRFMQKLDL